VSHHNEIERQDSEAPDSPSPGEIASMEEEYGTDPSYMLGRLLRQSTQIKEQLGEKPSRRNPHGSGILGQLAEQRAILGESPDEATGKKGTGLRGEVASLVRGRREQTVTIVKTVIASSAAIFGIVELLQQLTKFGH
jgi:hypothetical protein